MRGCEAAGQVAHVAGEKIGFRVGDREPPLPSSVITRPRTVAGAWRWNQCGTRGSKLITATSPV